LRIDFNLIWTSYLSWNCNPKFLKGFQKTNKFCESIQNPLLLPVSIETPSPFFFIQILELWVIWMETCPSNSFHFIYLSNDMKITCSTPVSWIIVPSSEKITLFSLPYLRFFFPCIFVDTKGNIITLKTHFSQLSCFKKTKIRFETNQNTHIYIYTLLDM